MRRTGQDCDCAPIALAAAVIVVTVATAIPAGAQDRLNLPEITIMGSRPRPTLRSPAPTQVATTIRSVVSISR